jgi:hypothetical protein
MKTATVTEVGLDFPKVLKWAETGEEVQVVKEGKTADYSHSNPRPGMPCLKGCNTTARGNAPGITVKPAWALKGR